MIGLDGISTFLPHVGARVGKFGDAPCASFVVEGGSFEGAAYAGVVLSPSVPTSGSTRIDAAIANPDSGEIELVEGEEGSGQPPGISSVAGALAHVTVIGRPNGKVLIERSQIADLRTVVPLRPGSFQMLERSVFILGAGGIPAVNSKIGSFTVVASKNWTVPKARVKGKDHNATGTAVSWVDLEYPTAVADLHLMVTPYDTLFSAAPNDSGDHPNGVGVTWKSLGLVSGKPRVRVMAAAAEGFGGEAGQRVFTLTGIEGGAKLAGDLSFTVQMQVWGRAS